MKQFYLKQGFLYCANSILSLKPFWSIQHVSLSRKVITPKVFRVFNKEGNKQLYPRPGSQTNEIPLDYLNEKELRKTFDDGILVVNKDNVSSLKNFTNKQAKKQSQDIPKYEKVTDHKNKFKEIMIAISIKKKRDALDMIVLEGKRLINDAINAKIRLKYIFFTSEDHLKDVHNLNEIIADNRTRLMKVLYKDMKIFSSLSTSPGIMAISERPNYNQKLLLNNKNDELPLTLICDNIRDPGNLGSILRTGAASGLSKILLTSGCVDLWNSKVIKSGAGAHFRIPIHSSVNWSQITEHLPEKFDLYIADSKSESTNNFDTDIKIKLSSYYDINFFNSDSASHKVLIIGNEAFGLSGNSYDLAREFSGHRIRIPLHHNVESLNSAMASSILLYEIRRQFEASKS